MGNESWGGVPGADDPMAVAEGSQIEVSDKDDTTERKDQAEKELPGANINAILDSMRRKISDYTNDPHVILNGEEGRFPVFATISERNREQYMQMKGYASEASGLIDNDGILRNKLETKEILRKVTNLWADSVALTGQYNRALAHAEDVLDEEAAVEGKQRGKF